MAKEFNYFTAKQEWINAFVTPDRLRSGQLDPKAAAQVLLFDQLLDELAPETLGFLCSALTGGDQSSPKPISTADACPVLMGTVDWEDPQTAQEAVAQYINDAHRLSVSLHERLLAHYQTIEPKSADELLALPAMQALFNSLNADYQDAFFRYLLLAPKLTVADSYWQKRSFHCTNPYAFVGVFWQVLKKLCVYQQFGCDFSAHLTDPQLNLDHYAMGEAHAYYAAVFQADDDMRALAQNVGSQYVNCLLSRDELGLLDRLQENFFAAEGVSAVSGTLLKGLIASGAPKALELVMSLLKAAKLSEGLRTSIVEQIDTGSTETFKYFLGYIDQANLYRFSSVQRSFITFSGLAEELSEKTIPKHAQWLAQGMLNDSAKDYLSEKNYVKFYLGLYLTACHNLDDTLAIISDRFLSWDRHQQVAALYFLKQAQLPLPAALITDLLVQVGQSELDQELVISVITNLREITFASQVEKREFLAACLPLFTAVKGSPRYYTIFGEGDSPYSSYEMTRFYDRILTLVDEVEDFYEAAYSVFSKYWSSWHSSPANMSKRLARPVVHKTVVRAVGSRISDEAKEILVKNQVELSREDFLAIGEFLRLKGSAVRANIAELMRKAKPDTVIDVAVTALKTRNKNKREGAVGILIDNYERIKDLAAYAEVKELLAGIDFGPTVAEQVSRLLGEGIAGEKLEADFYTPITEIPCPALTWDGTVVEDYLNYDFATLFDFVTKCYQVFSRHHGEEVEVITYDGSKVLQRVGFDLHTTENIASHRGRNITYQDYAFWQEFIPLTEKLENKDCILYKHFISLVADYEEYGREDKEPVIDYAIENGYLPDLHPWIKTWSNKNTKSTEQKYYLANAMQVLHMECLRRELFTGKGITTQVARQDANRYFAHLTAYHIAKEKERITAGVTLPVDGAKSARQYTYFNWLNYVARLAIGDNEATPRWLDDEDTLPWFDDEFSNMLVLNLIDLQKEQEYLFNITTLFRLEDMGLMSRDLLYTLILDPSAYTYKRGRGSRVSDMMSSLNSILRREKISRGTDWYRPLPYPQAMEEVYRNCAHYLANIEIGRTDADTPYSEAVSRCSEFYGTKLFFKALAKMGKMTFVRGYSWGHEGKKEMFSKIISRTLPEKDLNQKRFNELVVEYQISDDRLLEACIYNLRFIEYAERYLKLPGLTKAAYYFKAHLNERLSDEEKVIVRRYSDVEFADFQEGQMDLSWFSESYTQLGEEKFQWLYGATKYITDGGKHKRAQYFADAVRGKLDINEVEGRISDKRNQEMILAYGLIPLGMGKSENRDEDARLRYQRLQAFLKESKQFGAQRRASEALKVSIALNNLAKNYGLPATRFIWKMEAELTHNQATYFEPHELGEFTVYIDLARPEKPELHVYKNGKALKSVPARIRKEPYLKELKAVKAEVKDQYRRARAMLEDSMCQRTEFTKAELNELESLPVVAALLRDLLFISGEQIGFYQDGTFRVLSKDGNDLVIHKLGAKAKLRIAHPGDLVDRRWAAWQAFVMKNQIVQPFKQVFREFYVMTADERKADGYSQRFAGYQVAKNKALGLLSSRGWMLSDGGFEKVDHQSNLRVELYSYADWYTAGDVEEPSLEKVVFLNNKTSKTWDMAKLDPVIFSETMRDLDLVVSVAHVGGVDPAYEHTTIELRSRILEHNLSLLGITNYQIEGVHATIKGNLHEYSLHLGSGIIHVAGHGMLPVFPIHSQQRGRIFLPFVDSDPKTAEIITKALMLAEDSKIKDPAILAHLR